MSVMSRFKARTRKQITGGSRAPHKQSSSAAHSWSRSAGITRSGYPLGRGMQPFGEFDVVHIDAHTDFLDDLDGARLTGASQLRRLAELPSWAPLPRLESEMSTVSRWPECAEHGGRWATTRDLLDRGASSVVRETVPQTDALYVSIDLDVLDSSIAPGHSLQEPGGLSYRQLRATLIEVARRGRVIGFDVVELNPARDPSGTTARVATWIVTHFLSEIFDRPR